MSDETLRQGLLRAFAMLPTGASSMFMGVRGANGKVASLKQAVAWLNWHKQDDLWYYSTNQKDRAADVLKLKGARTGW